MSTTNTYSGWRPFVIVALCAGLLFSTLLVTAEHAMAAPSWSPNQMTFCSGAKTFAQELGEGQLPDQIRTASTLSASAPTSVISSEFAQLAAADRSLASHPASVRLIYRLGQKDGSFATTSDRYADAWIKAYEAIANPGANAPTYQALAACSPALRQAIAGADQMAQGYLSDSEGASGVPSSYALTSLNLVDVVHPVGIEASGSNSVTDIKLAGGYLVSEVTYHVNGFTVCLSPSAPSTWKGSHIPAPKVVAVCA